MRKKPFLIAEISANHCGSLKLAKKLIRCAKLNGADAAKIQTYTAETMTLNSKKKYFKINEGIWKNYTLWDLYNKAKTPLEWHKELFAYAKSIQIKLFSTPFDETAVDFLEKLNCPIYKISSFEITDLPLIKKVAQTKKPIIISTGMANMNEIADAYKTAKRNGAKDITLLYCVSSYPSRIDQFNLNNIKILKKKFKCKIGLSDHSTDNIVAICAVASGAEVIEKHIALEKQTKGFDIKFSLKGSKIKKFREDINQANALVVEKKTFQYNSDNKSRKFRRSIFACQNIKKGELFTRNNIKKVRPGQGLHPKYYKLIMNKKSLRSIKKNEPLKIQHYKKI
ncbi:pseudaminic acid synthase [Candidatus Pelagibacter ubique]|nr:pseudaminic acid synthase [Candidatus Pelagibacter ubique]